MSEDHAVGHQVLKSACSLDCPDACSLEVHVEQGRVVSIDGDYRNPLTQGFICSKVRRLPQALYGDDRVLYPAVRVGEKGEGRFERVSWDVALDLVKDRMQSAVEQWGGESILPFSYGGSNGMLTQDTTDARLFYRLGASRLARTICAAATGRASTGLYGNMPGIALSDYVHSNLIILWGINPSVSGIHLVPVLNEAQKRGATLVVIDPRRTQLAAKADLHLAPRPGTDLPLAMAMLRYLFEEGFADWDFLQKHAHGAEELRRRALPWKLERAAEVTGVPAEDIARLARMYAEASPAAIRSGWGIERNRNGGSAVAAVLALPAVGGKFGVRGGGYTMSNSGAYAFDRIAAANEAPPPTRVLNMSLLGRLITEDMAPPIKVLFVYNCNPLATMPNQELVRAGLERPDLFTVVSEQFWTDTTRYADVVLPATSFLEHSEVTRGFGSMVIQHPRAVALPPGEARPNYEMFADLCRRLGVDRPGDPETPEELEEALLNHSEWQRKQLREDDIAFPDLGWAPVQFVDSLPLTPDSKIHLVPEALDAEAPLGIYGYQADPDNDSLALISPASNRTISSYLGNLQRETARLDIHPEDAASRGVSDGDEVRVSNALGEVRVRARVTSDVARGVVVLPKGLWSFQTLSGTTANALAPDTLTDLGQGPCFNDARVEVTRVEERQPPS